MKPLLELADRHPLTTGFAGTASGFFAALMKLLDLTADVAGKLAAIVFFLNALLTFWFLVRKLSHNRAQRRLHLGQDLEPLE